MEGKIIEVKDNHGNGKTKMKVFSPEALTDEQMAPQRILCKRFSTKSRISRYQCA